MTVLTIDLDSMPDVNWRRAVRFYVGDSSLSLAGILGSLSHTYLPDSNGVVTTADLPEGPAQVRIDGHSYNFEIPAPNLDGSPTQLAPLIGVAIDYPAPIVEQTMEHAMSAAASAQAAAAAAAGAQVSETVGDEIAAQVPPAVSAEVAVQVPPAVTTEVGTQVPPAVTAEANSQIPALADSAVTAEVASQVPPAVTAETATQVPTAVTADIESRNVQLVAGATPGTVQWQAGDALGPEFPGNAVLVDGITDAGTVGSDVLGAETQAEGRAAIGAAKAMEFEVDFADKATVPTVYDTGQPLSIVGNAAPAVVDGQLVVPGTGLRTVYMRLEAAEPFHHLTCEFTLQAPPAGRTDGGLVTLAIGNENVTAPGQPVSLDLAAHVWVTRETWAITVYDGSDHGGPAQDILLTDYFPSPLPNDGTKLSFDIWVNGDTLTARLPDGTVRAATDPRVASYLGNHAFFQLGNDDTQDVPRLLSAGAETAERVPGPTGPFQAGGGVVDGTAVFLSQATFTGGMQIPASTDPTGKVLYSDNQWGVGSWTSPTADIIADSGAVGRDVVRAATQAEARNAIGAVDSAAVSAAIDAVIAGAPGALDTLNELAAALGNDADFAATVTGLINAKYTKPPTGIPKADLVAAVQTSLDKADTAYQAPAVVAAGATQAAARNAVGAAAPTDIPPAVRSGTHLVNIEDFDPDTDYGAALSAAIDVAASSGGTIIHRPGKTYTAHAGITKTDMDVRIDWNGAKVIRATDMANEPVLTLNYSNSTPQSVVGLTNTTYDWGGSGSNTPSTRIELGDTTGWSAGDWAVIVGDDLIPGSIPANTWREGERVRIVAVSGNYLYLARLLRVTLTTNIRIARLTVKDVLLTSPWVEDAPGSPTSDRNLPAIDILQAVEPHVVGARCKNLVGQAIRFAGCVDGVVDAANMYNLLTSSAENRVGYGFRLECCNDFYIIGVKGSYLRHLVTTTGHASTLDDPVLRFYGSNIGHRVFGGNAGEVGHSAFDTHEDAAFMVYDSCYVGWNHKEPEGSLYAFKIRGRHNTVQNCTSYGPSGLELVSFDGGGDHKIVNYTHTIPSGYAATGAIKIDYSAMSTRGKAEVSHSRIYASPYNGYLVYVDKATIRIPRMEITAASTQNPFRIFSITNSELIIGTLVVDLRGSTNNQRIFHLLDSASTVGVQKLIVISGGTNWRIADLSNLNGTVTIGRIETDTLPNVFHGGFINDGATATVSIGEIMLNQQSITNGVDVVTDANQTLNSFSKGVQLLDVPLAAARTITEPTYTLGGVGRSIRYIRTANATGGFNWTIGSDALTTAASALTRTWTGTAWVTTQKGSLT